MNPGSLRSVALLLVFGWFSGAATAQDPPALPPPILLPTPHMAGGTPLLDCLRLRRTSREFSPEPLPAQTLSDLLWAGFGVNRPESAHRTAPSAMNSQEIDLYVATPQGLYLFEPKPQRLRPLRVGDLRAQTGGQEFVTQAPVALIYVADATRMPKAKPAERAFYNAIDTGFISQNIYLFCAARGLATVVHELNRAPLAQAMRLRPEQTIVIAQSVGFPTSGAAVHGAAP